MQVLYKNIGRGTGAARIAEARRDRIDGARAAGTRISASPPRNDDGPVFVAGGNRFRAVSGTGGRRLDEAGFDPLMFYGARTFRRAPAGSTGFSAALTRTSTVTTDDGSCRRPRARHRTAGRACSSGEAPDRALHLYACGPEPMLKAVATPRPVAHGARLRAVSRGPIWPADSASAWGVSSPSHAGESDGPEGLRTCLRRGTGDGRG